MKQHWQAGKAVGLGCAMKNAGVGVGIPDTGRVKLIFEEGQEASYLFRCILYWPGTWHCADSDDCYQYRY